MNGPGVPPADPRPRSGGAGPRRHATGEAATGQVPAGRAPGGRRRTALPAGRGRTTPPAGRGRTPAAGSGRKALAAAALAFAPLLAGCGIRTTSVPVDAGPAPSRVSCAQPAAPVGSAPELVQRDVYLVCSMQVAPVKRDVRVGTGGEARAGRARLVQDLVAQLQISPRAVETSAGFSSAVPGPLAVVAPRGGDPTGTVRLSQPLDELPSFALAQIVCTLTADPTVAPAQSVILAGPGAGDRPRRYTCTSDLRTRPEAADSAGSPVG